MTNPNVTFSEGMPVDPYEEIESFEPHTSEFVDPRSSGDEKTTKTSSQAGGTPPQQSTTKALFVTTVGAGPGVPPNVTKIQWLDANDHVLTEISGLSVPADQFLAGVTQTSAADLYGYWTSLLAGNLTVVGSGQDDPFLEAGDGGTATIDGLGGNDKLYLWHQKDVVDYDGGDGVDTLEFSWNVGFFVNPTAGATVDLAAGTGTNPWGGTLILAHVERVIGEFNHDNNLSGDGNANFLEGGTAVDQLRGEGGDDTIYVKYWSKPYNQSARGTVADGGDAVDTLIAELSDGTAAPFTGSGPTLIVLNVLDLLHPEQNTGTFNGGTFDHFEVFRASNFDQTLRFDFRGSNAGETASGAAGPDLLDGRGGNDILSGFGRQDSLIGGGGNDWLFGGDSNDFLSGGAGRDQLNGGTGLDKFDFNAVGESVVGANRDIIADFKVAQHDKIDLFTIDADQRAGHPGNQKFVFIGPDTFAHYHHVHPTIFAMVRYAGGLVQANVNAGLAADFEIKLTGAPVLHGTDFVL